MHRHSAESVSPTDRPISGAGVAEKRAMASGSTDGPAMERESAREAQEGIAEEEETRKPQIARRPYTPTAAEVEAHLPLHLEFRSWCPHCCAGKGIATQHRKSSGERDDLGITVSLDYCFMTAEDVEDDMRAIWVCFEHRKKGFVGAPS